MHNVLSIILAAFGLGFLIFIHELGHYFMALRVGMTVEAFSIGFGKAILAWERKGVKWQVGWLPFGGFVRIKGMEKKGAIEPYQIPDGFFGKSPGQRIKVALMGPIFNILFAFVAFCLLWASGGREKSFAEYTHLIGWMDPCSELYEKGVRPGDEIVSYNGRPFGGFRDLMYAAVMREKSAEIAGSKINYTSSQREPFDYKLTPYQNPLAHDPSISTVGILWPANFLFYHAPANGAVLAGGSPIQESGIQPNDRIVWVDGELVFSLNQLSAIVNEPKTLVTFERGGQTLLTRIPRLKVSDLKLSTSEKGELDDWQHEAGLKAKVDQIYFMPYSFSHNAVVERELVYLNQESQECRYESAYRSPLTQPLMPGDKIVAIDGTPVSSSIDLIKAVQKRQVRIIVQRTAKIPALTWKDADAYFLAQVQWPKLSQIASTLGTPGEVKQSGDFILLAPVVPKLLSEMPLSSSQRSYLDAREAAQRKQIEAIENPQEKAEAMRIFESEQKKVKLGLSERELRDLPVQYNPSPFVLFSDVVKEIWRTLSSLFSGALSPKWLAGPVGIAEIIQRSWLVGFKEAVFWMGLISLNLGLLNLLPVPVLDGGHICFSLVEMVTKKPLKAKTMERLIIPFIVLLIALFVYLTYHDLIRLLGRFFK